MGLASPVCAAANPAPVLARLTCQTLSITLADMAIPQAQLLKTVSHPRTLAAKATLDPAWLEAIINGLGADTARVKYSCAKALRIIGETRPDVLYPRFDFFVALLNGDNKILQWEALLVLSHLVGVDTENRFAAVFDKYFSPG